MPQLDGGSALSLQKEILESRLGWTHQRTTKGDPEASNRNTLGDVTIDGDRVDDDSRGYRTTKRLLSRVALAFMGELPRFSDDTHTTYPSEKARITDRSFTSSKLKTTREIVWFA